MRRARRRKRRLISVALFLVMLSICLWTGGVWWAVFDLFTP